MDNLPRPEVILTHESDLDGFVAGHLLRRLARHLFQTEVRLEAWNTHAWRQRPMKERSGWVCDLAFDARFDRPDWLVVDHHPTDTKPRFARLIYDASQCAASLCYGLARDRGLASPALDRLVRLTNVGDLFLESDPEFTSAQDYASLVKVYQFWNLTKLTSGEPELLLDHPLLEVIRTKRQIEDPIGLEWSRTRVVELSPKVGYVEVVVGNTNLIVHDLLRAQECPFAVLATLIRKPSSAVVVSFRSRSGEALEVAQKLHGGGHPNASGAALPRSVQSIPDAVEYLKRVLNPQPSSLTSLDGAFSGLTLDP